MKGVGLTLEEAESLHAKVTDVRETYEETEKEVMETEREVVMLYT